MKTKKIIAGSLFLILFSTIALAGNARFTDFSKAVLAIKARPGYTIDHSKILILHPMVKDREVIIIHESKLNWKGNICTRTVIKTRQLKGKKAKGNLIGKTARAYYIPKKLKAFLTGARITNWKKSNNLKLDKKPARGYSFNATLKGETRIGSVFINSDGSLKAISFGFPKEGISHAKNMSDSGTTWYFEGKGKSLRLVKTYEVVAKKSNGIPFIKLITRTYSKF